MSREMYAGKEKTSSNLAWHRPQSAISLQEEELMQTSARAVAHTTDPLEKLRLLCLSRGACGILALGRVFRRMDNNGNKNVNKEEFVKGLAETGLEISEKEAEETFDRFNIDDSGFISFDELIKQIRPPMSDSRRAIVEKVFRKFDKDGHGVITVNDIRKVYCVNSHPLYMSGEETAAKVMDRFLANFEVDGSDDGSVTLEEFMNFYSGISVSIDNDCYFDLMMRQAYKL